MFFDAGLGFPSSSLPPCSLFEDIYVSSVSCSSCKLPSKFKRLDKSQTLLCKHFLLIHSFAAEAWQFAAKCITLAFFAFVALPGCEDTATDNQ